jgi:hypothetical protein
LSKGKRPKVCCCFSPSEKRADIKEVEEEKCHIHRTTKEIVQECQGKKTFSFSLYNDKSRKGVKISGMENKFREKFLGSEVEMKGFVGIFRTKVKFSLKIISTLKIIKKFL